MALLIHIPSRLVSPDRIGQRAELIPKRAAKPMAVLGTWNVIVTRGDGSEYFGTVWRGHAPEPGEVVEVKAAGRSLRARINRLIHFLPSATGPGIWRLSATETGLLLGVLRRQLLGTVPAPAVHVTKWHTGHSGARSEICSVNRRALRTYALVLTVGGWPPLPQWYPPRDHARDDQGVLFSAELPL